MSTVVIQMHHNNPPTLPISEAGKRQVWMRTAWDHNCEEAAQWAAGWDGKFVPQTVGLDIDHADILQAVGAAYQKMVVEWVQGRTATDAPKVDQLPYGWDTGAAVFHLMGNEDEFIDLAGKWADELIADADNIGGDDSYYDYYPDYIEGLHQLASQVPQCQAHYNRAHEALTAKGAAYDSGREFPDDPELPAAFEE